MNISSSVDEGVRLLDEIRSKDARDEAKKLYNAFFKRISISEFNDEITRYAFLETLQP